MREITFFIFLSFISFNLFSQTIKVENGISFSSMESSKIEVFLNRKIANYSFLAGIDYFEHKYYYISSEIGYIRKGGQEHINFSPSTINGNIKNGWDYMHLNTSFRTKYPINDSFCYLGVAPKLDILTSSPHFQDEIYSPYGYEMNKFCFGAKLELGIAQNINNFRIGINTSYILDIPNSGKNTLNPDNKLRNNTFLAMLSLGYKLH